jgi:hypothetical protein
MNSKFHNDIFSIKHMLFITNDKTSPIHVTFKINYYDKIFEDYMKKINRDWKVLVFRNNLFGAYRLEIETREYNDLLNVPSTELLDFNINASTTFSFRTKKEAEKFITNFYPALYDFFSLHHEVLYLIKSI